MANVMGRVVGECQHPFVEGRQILDVALVASKIVDDLLHKNREVFHASGYLYLIHIALFI